MAQRAQKAEDEKLQLGNKRKLQITGKMMRTPQDQESAITNMMMDARYLRQSASLIQDALKKGFDVLQMANGDIVTTGTKTIVFQYSWDEERGKLVRLKLDAKKRGTETAEAEELDAEEDA